MHQSPNISVGKATATHENPPESRSSYLGLTIIFAIGLIISIQLFSSVKNIEQERVNSRFLEAAKNRVALLQQEVKASLYEVETLGAFYSASEHISRHQFHNFVKPFLAHNPAIQALEWVPRVSNKNRLSHELAARKNGFGQYQITQRLPEGGLIRAEARAEYFPVYYVEPLAGNETAMGFDLASNDTRLATLKQASEQGLMLASARITLVQEVAKQQGFLVFSPVYKQDTSDKSDNALAGFALGVFRIGDTISRAVNQLDPLVVNMSLFDDSAPTEKSFLGHFPPKGFDHSQNSHWLSQQPMQYSESFTVAGRQWRVICTPTQQYIERGQSFDPWLVFSISLLLTLLLSCYIYFNIQRAHQGKEYTRHLLHSKESLQQQVEVRLQTEQELKYSTSRLETAHEKLISQQQQLVHSEKLASLGQLAAGVAHEINNPTGYVMGNLRVLGEYKHSIIKIFKAYTHLEALILESDDQSMKLALLEVNDVKTSQDLGFILSDMEKLLLDSISGTVRIQEFVEDLKDFSRVDNTDKKMTDINQEVIETTLRLVWNELKYKCCIDKNLAPLPKINCHSGELSQVVMNLLINACDAIPEKGTITLTSEHIGNNIKITVSDNGSGISDTDIAKLFNPFFTTKGLGKGTGLGLPISQGIVKNHGGSLTVHSQLGKGSSFIVQLPISTNCKTNI